MAMNAKLADANEHEVTGNPSFDTFLQKMKHPRMRALREAIKLFGEALSTPSDVIRISAPLSSFSPNGSVTPNNCGVGVFLLPHVQILPPAAHASKPPKGYIRVSFDASPQLLPELVRAFLNVAMEQVVASPLWSGAPPSELAVAAEALEKFVMLRAHDRAFASSEADHAADAAISARLNIVGHVLLPTDLDVPMAVSYLSNGRIEPDGTPARPPLLLSAVEELQQLWRYRTPRDKLVCMANACEHVQALVQGCMNSDGSSKSFSADEFVAALVFVAALANPPHFSSNIRYIEDYRDQRSLCKGMYGYFFTCIQSVKCFWESVQPDQLQPLGKVLSRDDYVAVFGRNVPVPSDLPVESVSASARVVALRIARSVKGDASEPGAVAAKGASGACGVDVEDTAAGGVSGPPGYVCSQLIESAVAEAVKDYVGGQVLPDAVVEAGGATAVAVAVAAYVNQLDAAATVSVREARLFAQAMLGVTLLDALSKGACRAGALAGHEARNRFEGGSSEDDQNEFGEFEGVPAPHAASDSVDQLFDLPPIPTAAAIAQGGPTSSRADVDGGRSSAPSAPQRDAFQTLVDASTAAQGLAATSRAAPPADGVSGTAAPADRLSPTVVSGPPPDPPAAEHVATVAAVTPRGGRQGPAATAPHASITPPSLPSSTPPPNTIAGTPPTRVLASSAHTAASQHHLSIPTDAMNASIIGGTATPSLLPTMTATPHTPAPHAVLPLASPGPTPLARSSPPASAVDAPSPSFANQLSGHSLMSPSADAARPRVSDDDGDGDDADAALTAISSRAASILRTDRSDPNHNSADSASPHSRLSTSLAARGRLQLSPDAFRAAVAASETASGARAALPSTRHLQASFYCGDGASLTRSGGGGTPSAQSDGANDSSIAQSTGLSITEGVTHAAADSLSSSTTNRAAADAMLSIDHVAHSSEGQALDIDTAGGGSGSAAAAAALDAIFGGDVDATAGNSSAAGVGAAAGAGGAVSGASGSGGASGPSSTVDRTNALRALEDALDDTSTHGSSSGAGVKAAEVSVRDALQRGGVDVEALVTLLPQLRRPKALDDVYHAESDEAAVGEMAQVDVLLLVREWRRLSRLCDKVLDAVPLSKLT